MTSHVDTMEAGLTKASTTLPCLGIALLFVLCDPAIAENARVTECFDRGSNANQRNCLHDLYRAAQTELDQTYREKLDRAIAIEADVRARNPADPPAKGPSWPERIAASQKAWEAYREAECWGVVGQPGGSGRMTWAYGCLAEKTFERIDELKVPFDQR